MRDEWFALLQHLEQSLKASKINGEAELTSGEPNQRFEPGAEDDLGWEKTLEGAAIRRRSR